MKREILRALGVPRMTTTTIDILRGLRAPGWRTRVPGWARLTDAAREAVIDELAALPEDVGAERVREPVPACARVNEVIDALDRAASRGGVTESDRLAIAGWKTLGHAGSIAAFLDLATLASQVVKSCGVESCGVAVRSTDDAIVGACSECGEPIAVGEDFQRLAHVRQAEGAEGEEGVSVTPIAVHRECMALRVVGHEYGVCSCTNYAGIPTVRAAARETMRRLRAADRRRRAEMDMS